MKGITGNSVLDAYQRMAVSRVEKARPPERTESTAASHEPGTPAAQITISARAQDLATDSPGFQLDSRKVEALKDQIKQRSFNVNSQLIAQKMLTSTA
jgi:flagellar biosynthesis anti-sigma factor FlgM